MKKRFQLFICVQVLFKHILIPVSFGTVLAPRAHPHPVAYAAWWRSCLSSATSLRERTNIHHHHHQSTSVFAVSRCVYLEDAGGIVDGMETTTTRHGRLQQFVSLAVAAAVLGCPQGGRTIIEGIKHHWNGVKKL